MKGFVRLAFVALAIALVAVGCKKDEEDTATLSFNTPAVYFEQPEQVVTVSFTANDVQSLSITGRPSGWSQPVIDLALGTVTITAPKLLDGSTAAKTGTIVLTGRSGLGNPRSASLFVGVVGNATDLSDKPANCFVVNQPDKQYTFDVAKMGVKFKAASVRLIWQTAADLVQFVYLNKDKASFYVGANTEDNTKIKEGNALIGAYDANGTLLWSWHIWATGHDFEANVLKYDNGYQVMDRNLGALNNANSTTAEILASLGLYYQWGRKDPFIGPSSYQASNGADAVMYNASSMRVYRTSTVSTAETGTQAYATANPLCFITGTKDKNYDWMWTSSDVLWGATKNENDPCPFGWKVAPAGALSGLKIASTPVAEDFDKYGWKLSLGSVSSLYMGAGRRVYLGEGKFQNVYFPPEVVQSSTRNPAVEGQPWVGYYWLAASAAKSQSAALYFWFEKKTTTGGIIDGEPFARANGMSVRCVKDTFR